jgi:hypothetical protein
MATSLSRLELMTSIIGSSFSILDLEIPTLVLDEVRKAHGLSEEVYPNLISTSPVKMVKNPPSKEDWRYIARYINADVKSWPQGSKLKEAFSYLHSLQNLDLSQVTPDFPVGPQTPEEPRSLNGCVLYALCRKHGIKTWPEMGYSELAFAVKSLLVSPLYLLNHFVLHLRELPAASLVNFYLEQGQTLQKFPTPQEVTKARLEEATEVFQNIYRLQEYIYPRQPSEAVILAACRYHLDISTSRYPFEEIQQLQTSGQYYYQPVDPIMRMHYSRNPQLYSIEYHFNPLLPEKCYSREILEELLQGYGYKREYHTPTYTQLGEIYLLNNFYHGSRPGLRSNQTCFDLEDVSKLESNSVVVYGTPSGACPFTPFTYAELADFFQVNKAFLHPLEKGKQLQREEIARLRYLVSTDRLYPHDTSRCQEQRRRLEQTLIMVEALADEIQADLREFLTSYEQVEIQTQGKIRETLHCLLELGMYMRGWEGEGHAYPVEEAPYKAIGEVCIRVCESLQKWYKQLETLGEEWASRIQALPLVTYNGGYVLSNEPTIGLTIGDKIEIIAKGEEHTSVSGSCIRVSSSWLLASAHRYMAVIGMDLPFVISKLVHVT